MVDCRSYKCKRVVHSSLAGETQACGETPDMLELTEVFYSLCLGNWKRVSDLQFFFRKTQRVP